MGCALDTLTTERLTLRGFTMEDLGDFYAYAKSPRVGPSAGWKPHESLTESRELLRGFIEADEVWAIALRENGRVVGSIGLHKGELRPGINCRMLGYVLAEGQWGKGLMHEAATAVLAHAFDEMALELVYVHHYPHNARSRRVIEKCGFVYEGTLRHAAKGHDGTVHDLCCYSILRDEYYKK